MIGCKRKRSNKKCKYLLSYLGICRPSEEHKCGKNKAPQTRCTQKIDSKGNKSAAKSIRV